MLITEYLMAGKKKDLRWLGYNSSHTSFARSAAGLQHGVQLNSENWCFWDLRLFGSAGLVVVVVCIHNCKASISLCLFEGIGSNAVQERRCHTRPSQKPSWFPFLSCRRRRKSNDNTFSKKATNSEYPGWNSLPLSCLDICTYFRLFPAKTCSLHAWTFAWTLVFPIGTRKDQTTSHLISSRNETIVL